VPTTLTAIIETVPPDHTGVGHDPQQREVTAQGATYADALASLRGDLPERYRICWVRTV